MLILILLLIGTINTTLNMDDINANTAVLSIYDPVFDYNDTNTITKIDDVRLIKNNHTEACFTRVIPSPPSTVYPPFHIMDHEPYCIDP